MITVTPKVTSSEVNSLTRNHEKTACSPTPSAKNSGTMRSTAVQGASPPTVPSW